MEVTKSIKTSLSVQKVYKISKIVTVSADDVDILALAIRFNIPVWSNDNDFEDAGVEWYTTDQLLKKLGVSE